MQSKNQGDKKLRKGFLMSVHPGKSDEYKRRHDEIWPEMQALLGEHGVITYSIFFLESTHQLFAYAEIENEERWNAIAKTEICRRWWKYMSDIMAHLPDNSPKVEVLSEVFYFNTSGEFKR